MKIEQLFNLAAAERFLDSHTRQSFSDSANGIVLERYLTSVNPRIFEKKYPELAFVNSGIQTDNTGGYANRIQSLRVLEQGGFRTAGDTSNNKGRISLAAEDSYIPVVEREVETIWTDTEIQQAQLGGYNLVERYITAVNKRYLQEVDHIGLLGLPDYADSYGLLNHPSFTADGFGHNITASSDAEDDYNELAAFINAQRNAVNNTPEYVCNRVMLPVSVTNVLSVKLLNLGNASNITVLQALKNAFPDITFHSSFRAESVSGAKRAVAYSTNEEVMVNRIPVPLLNGEIIKTGSFNFKTDYKYRVAGLDVLEPTGARIATGL